MILEFNKLVDVIGKDGYFLSRFVRKIWVWIYIVVVRKFRDGDGRFYNSLFRLLRGISG